MSEVIGSSAAITPPKSVEWSGIVNFRPGDGDTVTVNPPRFSWSYTADPLNTYSDNSVHNFVFQIDNNSDFSSPSVSVQTDCNFYNFLAPLATGTWYWRVGYCAAGGFTVTQYCATRTFTITGAETTWDRSMLADATYLATQAAHPHILFNSSNKAALHTYLTTSQSLWWGIFRDAYADAAIATAWWTEGRKPNFVTEAPEGTWAQRIRMVSFFHALTGDAKYNGVATQIVLMANEFTAQGLATVDEVSNSSAGDFPHTIALGYDWCYDLLSAGQKTTIRTALALRCDKVMNVNRAWKDTEFGGTTTQYFSMAKRGNAHGMVNLQNTFVPALAAYGEDATCRAFFDLMLNYMIGVGFPFGFEGTINQGRGYLPSDINTSVKMLEAHMLAHLSFPTANLNANPFWNVFVDWLDRFIPVGHTQGHDPWGDADGVGGMTYWGTISMGRSLAQFTGSGRAQRHYANQFAINGGSPNEDQYTLSFLGLFTTPTEASTSAGSALYPDGWAMSSSATPSTLAGFKAAVAMVFMARPRGSEGGHSHWNDLNFQIWAYGAPITDSGAAFNYYAKIPWASNVLTVNGLATVQPFPVQVEPSYAKFIGWKVGASYLYVAADATAAYPRTSFTPSGALMHGTFSALHTGAPLASLTKVHRHILFMRNKYFVIFDDMASGASSTFSWVYHARTTATVDAANKKFNYTILNLDGLNVTTYVQHIGTGIGLTLTNQTGGAVATNPITGENYNAYDTVSPNTNTIWVKNTSLATSHHFLTVIYPVAPLGFAPTITRIDDKTVRVQSGLDDDTISFDPANTTANFVVDLFGASGGGDETAPLLTSNTINTAGTTLTLGFNESVTFGAGGNSGWTASLSGGAATLTYSSGGGSSSLVYTFSRTVNYGETGTVSYTQPTNGVEDASGNDLATISGSAVTNNSTQIVSTAGGGGKVGHGKKNRRK